MSYFELISGLGSLIGPLLGSGFYYGLGYVGPFFCLGGLYLIMIIVFFIVKKLCNVDRVLDIRIKSMSEITVDQ